MSPQPATKSVVPRSFGAPRAWRFLGAPLRGASLLGDFAKSPGDRGSPPGSRVLSCSCVSVCQSVPGRAAAGTRLPGTPVKAELLVVQWLRVWHTTLLKTPYIPPRKQSDLPRGPLLTYPSPALSSSPWSPALPPQLILFIVLSSFISFPFFSPSLPPLARPSILLLHHPLPSVPPLSNQHKMVLKLLLALQAAAQAPEAAAAAAAAQAAAVVAAAVYCDWWLALGWSVPLIY